MLVRNREVKRFVFIMGNFSISRCSCEQFSVLIFSPLTSIKLELSGDLVPQTSHAHPVGFSLFRMLECSVTGALFQISALRGLLLSSMSHHGDVPHGFD